MNQAHDDAIDALLRRRFDGPVADDGFCDRVMHRLPPRRRRVAWPLWCGILVGAVACWLSLRVTPLLHAGWRDWLGGELSAPAAMLLLATAGMSLLALGWILAEAEDR